MSKFLDSRFNKISYLTPLFSSSYITPKLTSLGVESEGRFRRVASYVFGIQNACYFADFDGPDGPKFDVRARGFLALPPPAGGQGVAPSGARFAPPGWSSPSRWAGSGCVSVKGALRPSSQSSPCSPCGLCVAPGCSGRPLTLPHPQNAPTGLSEPRGYVQAAWGHRHRIALGGPLRPPDGHSGPAWSSPAPQAWFRGSAPAPQPVRLDALADGSIEPLPERLALSMGGSDRRVSGLGRHPRGRTTEQAAALFGNSRHRLNPFNENNVLSKSGQHRLTRKHTRFGPRR